MPSSASAHTFYAFLETWFFFCLFFFKRRFYFCAVYNDTDKGKLSKVYWDPKRKLRLTAHFSEIIKIQFGKNAITPYFLFQQPVLFSAAQKYPFALEGTDLKRLT